MVHRWLSVAVRVGPVLVLAGLVNCNDVSTRATSSMVRAVSKQLHQTPDPLAWHPSPYRRRGPNIVALNESCEGCHLDVAEQWRSSRHHLSFSNSAFAASFAVEPKPFCRGCHAPEAADPGRTTVAEEALGVGCVSCHVDDSGAIHAALQASVARERSPHGVIRDAQFATSDACVGCHDFPFPGRQGVNVADGDMMQTTTREHRDSAAAVQGCADCHMPIADGRRSHDFGNVRNVAWLRNTLDVRAEQSGESIVVYLRQKVGGHAMPTGDLFRRLQVGVERTRRGGAPERKVVYLARRFVHDSNLPGGYRLVADDRLFDDERRIELPLACEAAGDSVRYWVTLQRVAQIGRGDAPDDAQIASEVVLARGEVCRL